MLFSEPKIPQSREELVFEINRVVSVLFSEPKIPQFINPLQSDAAPTARFSALQRAENSSIDVPALDCLQRRAVSVLFSEPKIPQWISTFPSDFRYTVSVLFSEPKIPQSANVAEHRAAVVGFSALQRAENSSM